MPQDGLYLVDAKVLISPDPGQSRSYNITINPNINKCYITNSNGLYGRDFVYCTGMSYLTTGTQVSVTFPTHGLPMPSTDSYFAVQRIPSSCISPQNLIYRYDYINQRIDSNFTNWDTSTDPETNITTNMAYFPFDFYEDDEASVYNPFHIVTADWGVKFPFEGGQYLISLYLTSNHQEYVYAFRGYTMEESWPAKFNVYNTLVSDPSRDFLLMYFLNVTQFPLVVNVSLTIHYVSDCLTTDREMTDDYTWGGTPDTWFGAKTSCSSPQSCPTWFDP